MSELLREILNGESCIRCAILKEQEPHEEEHGREPEKPTKHPHLRTALRIAGAVGPALAIPYAAHKLKHYGIGKGLKHIPKAMAKWPLKKLVPVCPHCKHPIIH
jgi:hypothetical protein